MISEEEQPFSGEYQKGTTTEAEEGRDEGHISIELQLEAELAKEAKRYGTGKPRREVLRAKIIHD